MTGHIGKYLAVLYRRQQKYVRRSLAQYDLGYSDFHFLLYLANNDGASQTGLCRQLAVDEALATRAMRKLTRRGFVQRSRLPEDQRSYALSLTPQGQALIPKLRAALQTFWGEVTAGYSEQEIARLMQLLQEMSERAAGCCAKLDEEGGISL